MFFRLFTSFLLSGWSLELWNPTTTTIQGTQKKTEYLRSVPRLFRFLDLYYRWCLFLSGLFSEDRDQSRDPFLVGSFVFCKSVINEIRSVCSVFLTQGWDRSHRFRLTPRILRWEWSDIVTRSTTVLSGTSLDPERVVGRPFLRRRGHHWYSHRYEGLGFIVIFP